MSDQKGWIWYDPDIGMYVYRGFSFGSCIRSLVAARMGEDEFPNQYMRPYLDASGGLEEAIIKRLAADHNVVPMWQQRTVELPIEVVCEGPDDKFVAKVVIRGHLDLADRVTDDVIEVKALGPNNFEKYDRGGLAALGTLGQKYAVQGGIYGHATERRVRFAIGEKLKNDTTGEFYIGRVIYEPSVDASELITRDLIEMRVRTIEEHAAMDELPECDMGCSENDAYGEVHLFASAKDGGEELFELLHRYREIKTLIGDKGDEKKDKPPTGLLGEQADIKAVIEEQFGEGKHVAGPYTARLSKSPGKEFIDTYWLKKNHPEIYEMALRRGKPYTQLVVTEKKRKESGSAETGVDTGVS